MRKIIAIRLKGFNAFCTHLCASFCGVQKILNLVEYNRPSEVNKLFARSRVRGIVTCSAAWFLIFLIFSVFFSCASVPEKSGENLDVSQLQGKWLLTALAGNPFRQDVAQATQKKAFIEFDVETMQVSGNSGINQFGGIFTISQQGKLEFSLMRSTLMAGLNMETESSLYSAFARVTSYVIKGGVLSLLDENGNVLVEYTKAL